MTYVDGFVLPLPRTKIAAYRKLAKLAAKVWMDHGALHYAEAIGDDLAIPVGLPYPKLLKLKRTEVPVFSWITYKSKAHRNKVVAKVMADPRLTGEMSKMPFDVKRMSYGGFQVLVEAKAR